MKKTNKKEVIIALDFDSQTQVFDFLQNFDTSVYVKVGMELFYSQGRQIVEKLKQKEYKIFLDLKLHDIPNTVASAIKVLSNLGVDMCNVHCGGGIEMMSAAKQSAGGMKLLGVTQLTSISQQILTDQLLIDRPLNEVVLGYAQNAKKSGLDGIVCSPFEAQLVKENCGGEFLTVTPGIRLADNSSDDQKRVATPQFAKANSDFIVVGRPITRAKNPQEVYQTICSQFLN